MSMYEIERKYYLAKAPSFLPDLASVYIRQGYLAIEAGGNEVRLRQKGDTYWLTVKSSGGLKRVERELSITQEDFENLWTLTEGRRLEKRRYLYQSGPCQIEIDAYQGALKGLYTAEIEFSAIEEAESFQAPAWLNQEVTGKPQFQNRYLAQLPNYQEIIANL